MDRRKFIKNLSLASATVPFMVDNIMAQALPNNLFNVPVSYEDRVLVMIRMSGGNDGLNMVIPIDQYDNLMIQRPNIIIPENKIIQGTYDLGFHPALNGISEMFNDGKASVIQNVGYQEQNRSHFRSMDIWSTGSTEIYEKRGWLGRYFEQNHPEYPDNYPNNINPDPFAVSMGNSISTTCQGTIANFSTLVSKPSNTYNLEESLTTNDGTLNGCNSSFVTTLIEQTNAYGLRINAAYDAGNSLSQYYYIDNNPQNDFKSKISEQLKYVAQMISGGMQTKLYILDVNGFDTHNEQVDLSDTSTGVHAELLQEISDAVYAFQNDLELLGLDKRVMGMTFSEFGRQIASNGSAGTDHGDAAPLFLFGKCISSSIIGNNPVILDEITNQKGVDMQIDFRDVYASILKDWFRISEDQITTIFENHSINYLTLMDGCYSNGLHDEEPTLIWPNPAGEITNLDFYTPGGDTRVNLVDMRGRIVRNYMDMAVDEGRHKLELNLNGVSKGIYRISIVTMNGNKSVSLAIQ